MLRQKMLRQRNAETEKHSDRETLRQRNIGTQYH